MSPSPKTCPPGEGARLGRMSRIDWGRRSGDEVETVVGILLCRRHNAERITPSQGDDGLDVILREDDAWTIWQVKKYASQPNSNQRAKIAKSLSKAAAFAKSSDVTIKRWHVVMPANQTPPSLKWFRKLTEDQPFPCTWLGEDFLDGLAAEFPDVIDYYFRDGKDRLSVALAEFSSMIGAPSNHTEEREIQPASAMESILAAHRLINKLDPHFRYDFSVDSNLPTLKENNQFIFAETRGKNGQYFTFRIFEKYRGALNDRPITLKGNFRAPDEQTREAVRDFFDFGVPLNLDNDFASMEADLPGGLDGSQKTGALQILQPETPPESHRIIRMRSVGPDGGDEKVVRLRMPPATSGVWGQNLRSVAKEEGGAFTVEHRYFGETDILKLNFLPEPISGRQPNKILAGLYFLKSLNTTRSVQLGAEFGPFMGNPMPISKDLTSLVDDNVLELVESIAYLQEHTTSQLTVPNLRELSMNAGECIVMGAKLLRDETVVAYVGELAVTPNESPVPEGEGAMFTVVDHDVTVNDVVIPIGPVAFHAERVNIIALKDTDGVIEHIVVRPSGEEKKICGTLRRMSAD